MLFRYNPFWWLCILLTALCILLGHCFHMILGQGGKVRDDEDENERRARVWWAYSYSGAQLATITIDVCAWAAEAADEVDESYLHSMTFAFYTSLFMLC